MKANRARGTLIEVLASWRVKDALFRSTHLRLAIRHIGKFSFEDYPNPSVYRKRVKLTYLGLNAYLPTTFLTNEYEHYPINRDQLIRTGERIKPDPTR